jgi:hypothetical protein
MTRRSVALLVTLLSVLASLTSFVAPAQAFDRSNRIYLVGDSTMAAMRWYSTEATLAPYDYIVDAESCRRVTGQSCRGREGYIPSNALQALQAQVRQESVQLHYYRVTAPGAGIVGDIPVRVGDRVTTTTPLTTVDKPGSLEAYVYLPIERSSQLKMNLPVQIVDQSGNVIAESRISFISPQVDSTTQTVLAKAPIANNNDKLRNAQFIHARIVWGTQQRTVVPILAVSRLVSEPLSTPRRIRLCCRCSRLSTLGVSWAAAVTPSASRNESDNTILRILFIYSSGSSFDCVERC